jgi:cyclopropane fatty-acyl-phospholipid synthase-like methyltransferase
LEKLGLSSERSFHHAASGGVFLADILKGMEIPRASRVVDLGCGKGSALWTLAWFPFEHVAGVELSVPLARIAEENIKKLGLKNVSVHVSDAADYRDFDQFTHIYMFNPFPCAVMAKVLNNLKASLIRRPRQLTIVYSFPTCHDTIMQSGLFGKVIENKTLIHPINIYISAGEQAKA